ncbi:unnamed protein product [Triticum turgidum subsp. durum]|uniref:Dilute domain-containing protein n=1 Tax=Triticum turgidum subsp. durum TaxID=4567 RepID=A0A9R0Q7K0_TRITD|nr:unnamed protein product [Triticum turgidum subsp. durum]
MQVIFKKFRISYDEIVNDLCPVLSVQQLYKICTQYWDDKYNTESVSEELFISSPYIVKHPKAQTAKISTLYSNLDNQTEHNLHMLFAMLGECDRQVLDEMRTLMTEESGHNASEGAFLLDDEISMPISLEEIADSMDVKEFQNVAPPSELVAMSAFQFLKS